MKEGRVNTMRRLLSASMIILLLIVLCACGGKSNVVSDSYSTGQTAPTQETGYQSPAEPAASESVTESASADSLPESTPVQEPEVNLEWSSFSYTITDRDGYTYEISYEVSPWILLSNEEVINAAWAEVGGNNKLPGFDGWGLKWDGSVYFRPNDIPKGGSREFWTYPMSDMYYCMGKVSVRNTTDGWDISESNKRSFDAVLGWKSGSTIPEIEHISIGAYTIGKTFYSSATKEQANCVLISPSMTSNKWGPVSFVLMAPENFSPKYPDGQFYDHTKTGALSFIQGGSFLWPESEITNDDIRIGIIGKSGEYEPPEG